MTARTGDGEGRRVPTLEGQSRSEQIWSFAPKNLHYYRAVTFATRLAVGGVVEGFV